MNPLFEELLAQAPGQTPVMPAAPTVASTGGTVAQPLTPAGQTMANSVLHGLMFPGQVATGQAQVFDDQGHTTDEAVNWGVDRALGGLRAASIPKTPIGPREVAFGSGPIRAYHGSPHDFDRFDLSKVGTGEGAQAYGHGLYFAEKEPVAMQYRNQLAPPSVDTGGFRNIDVELAKIHGGDWDAFKAAYPNPTPALAKAIAEIEAKGGPKITPSQGRMYEVAIHEDPAKFLNYDVPMSQQSQSVRKALKDLPEYRAGYDLSARIGMPRGDEAGYGIADTVGMGARVTGRAPDGVRPDVVASQLMNEAGIPGIRYLDQGSRAAGDGSRNYVTFSDKIVEIMRKYGVASFAALPPAVQMMLQRGQTETPAGNGGLGGLGGFAPRA